MSKIIIWIIAFYFWVAVQIPAQPSGNSIGVALHNGPALVTGKFWITQDFALDAATTFNFQKGFNYVYFHGNFLVHDFSVLQAAGGNMPIYYGGGLRTQFGGFYTVGVRAPLGASYIYGDNVFEMFFELAPFIDVVESAHFSLDGAIGFRIFL